MCELGGCVGVDKRVGGLGAVALLQYSMESTDGGDK